MEELGPMTIKILLVSRNVDTIEMICHLAQQLSLHVEPCCDFQAARAKLCHSKYEGLIVDLDPKEGGLELLMTLRHSTSHRNAITFAIVPRGEDRSEAFDAGANFTFDQPIMPALVLRTLRASYPLMVREKRRYFRTPLLVPLYVSAHDRSDFVAHSVNISEGGLAVESTTPVNVGDELRLRFTLPESDCAMLVTAVVCWSNGTGRFGLQFHNLPGRTAEALQVWLANRLQQVIPAGASTHTHQRESSRL